MVYAPLFMSLNALICLPKFCMTFVFLFPLGITAVPREIENNACAKLWGVNEVHYGKCGSGMSGLRRHWLG